MRYPIREYLIPFANADLKQPKNAQSLRYGDKTTMSLILHFLCLLLSFHV